MTHRQITLGDSSKRGHAYDVYTGAHGNVIVFVRAANRDHAARIASRAGYDVYAVNMVGR